MLLWTVSTAAPAPRCHRPCMLPVEHTDDAGRVRKRYSHDAVMTPYERLRSFDAERFLKPGITFRRWTKNARAITDLSAMREVRSTSADHVVDRDDS